MLQILWTVRITNNDYLQKVNGSGTSYTIIKQDNVLWSYNVRRGIGAVMAGESSGRCRERSKEMIVDGLT